MNEDDENQFPFKGGRIEDENERNQMIFEVLKQIKDSADGRYRFPLGPVQPLPVDIVRSVSKSDMAATAQKYQGQMTCLDSIFDKDADLQLSAKSNT